ncbi:MAG: tetratricopeptide repeat protein [Roseofilum sp. Belize BBD 4]|uniref:tetratricopeptide repeat protein n=2 Tax=unclassified Roseofilum TaxID=2620099 RepID=UPI001B1E41AB|nr:tetratricopeptide repeat protein [Roseofilum sp. Belize BBD 4]MBP0033707.1 tetratricopeptide repeat protein [Roseofilum sp. Belize BBD 4]
MMGNNGQTLEKLDRDITNDPQNAKAWAGRGETYRLMKRYQEALEDFNRAIELKPDYAWALAHRGETSFLMDAFEGAIEDFNRAIELQPNYIWALAHRGVTYERIEHYEEALVDLDRAIELQPDYAWAIAYRCRTYGMLRRYEEALVEFDRAIALDKTIIKEDWRAERGLFLSFMGRYAEAIEHYYRALEDDPKDSLTLYWMAITKARWKGLAEARREIEQAQLVLQAKLARMGSQNSAVIYELGGLAAIEGRNNEALAYLEEAMSLDYYPKRRAFLDLAWLDLHLEPRFQQLTGYKFSQR